ncbi:DUF4349 domain-containing protein [Belliella sp. R4-6]|uniref:DUF4349 domain-containing protein n=1 Tax=Belliella alkalica TaxID=1730871 RepID=A0ABS9V762_9BACT|nr:DUF4349 domain-containing protein [Belliella alkalica]MCH7412256.1 DUF4349 domain-containing protein [Belliella alkalica]
MTHFRSVAITTFHCFLIILFFSCGNKDNDAFSYSGNDTSDFEELLDIPITEQVAPQTDGEAYSSDIELRKFIKTGGIEFESEDIDNDFDKIRKILPKYNAYIESENLVNNHRQKTVTIIVRVPLDAYDTIYNQLTKIGLKVDNVYSNIEDVTSRYSDLDAKIENKKLLEVRYRELLLKAVNIKDMLEIERSMNDLRSEIDMFESRFKLLKQQIRFSTINIRFYENLPAKNFDQNGGKFLPSIRTAIMDGLVLLQNFIVFLFKLWPFVLLALVGFFFWKRIRKVKN